MNILKILVNKREPYGFSATVFARNTEGRIITGVAGIVEASAFADNLDKLVRAMQASETDTAIAAEPVDKKK